MRFSPDGLRRRIVQCFWRSCHEVLPRWPPAASCSVVGTCLFKREKKQVGSTWYNIYNHQPNGRYSPNNAGKGSARVNAVSACVGATCLSVWTVLRKRERNSRQYYGIFVRQTYLFARKTRSYSWPCASCWLCFSINLKYEVDSCANRNKAWRKEGGREWGERVIERLCDKSWWQVRSSAARNNYFAVRTYHDRIAIR